MREKQSSACSNISVIEEEPLSRILSLFQRREKEQNLRQPAAEQQPHRAEAQYINFPTSYTGILLSYYTAFESKHARCSTHVFACLTYRLQRSSWINVLCNAIASAETEITMATNDMPFSTKLTYYRLSTCKSRHMIFVQIQLMQHLYCTCVYIALTLWTIKKVAVHLCHNTRCDWYFRIFALFQQENF